MPDDHDRNDQKKGQQYDSSRRKFLKGVGVAGAGAALADHFISPDKAVAASESVNTGAPVAGSVNIALEVNGAKRTVTVEPRTTLLNALRNNLEPAVTGP